MNEEPKEPKEPRVSRRMLRNIRIETEDWMGDPIEISATEWANGEGTDFSVGDKVVISLHESEIQAIRMLMNAMDAEKLEDFEERKTMYERH